MAANERPSSCSLCRYQMADVMETPHKGYYCYCEDSPLFGTIVSQTGTEGPGCDCYSKHRYDDMDLMDAMKIITDSSWRQTNTMFVPRKTEDGSPMLALWFKTNADLEDWRDALLRFFSEVMEYRQANGEFEEEC